MPREESVAEGSRKFQDHFHLLEKEALQEQNKKITYMNIKK